MTTRIVLAALLAALFLPSALARADNPRLVATVGRNDAFAISLSDASGAPVTHLDPGAYDIAVPDLSEQHNFHLHGPGVEQATSVGNKEDVVWTVMFTDGKYAFECAAHPAARNVTPQPGIYSYRSDKHKSMRGSLVVTLPV